MTKAIGQHNKGEGRRETARPEQTRPEQNRIVRGLFTTIPIVLAGSLAMSLNVTGPIHTTDLRRDKPRATPSELGKSIRDAFTAAARAATNPAASPVSQGAITVAAAPATYRVVAGDTVSSIAGRHGLATASVLALNGLSWKSLIFAGQTLKLSMTGAVAVVAPVTNTPTGRYTIQKGDSIGGIAAKFGLATQTLLSANGLAWKSIIYPGQTIAIPGSTGVASVSPTSAVRIIEAASAPAASGTPVTYTIASGDTITTIAAKFGVTVQAILTANNLTWSSIVYGGHTLAIPPAAPVVLPSSTTVVALTREMAANARTIVSVGRSLGVPNYGLVVGLAAAAQESGLRNLNYGDRDSIGIFQQRPSTGWGTVSQILEPTYAARLFFGGPKNPNAANTRGLLDIPGWQAKSVTDAAQAVQLSGFPTAYAKWETSARSWLAAMK
jgi:LysM repeat protein